MSKTMTSRERLVAAYRREPVDRAPCSPRLWAWLIERYKGCGPAEYLAAADEFDFDIHLNRKLFSAPCEVGAGIAFDLPGVTAREERSRVGDFTAVRRRFFTPEGELTDVTLFPPADRAFGISPNPHRSEYMVKSPDDLKRIVYLILPPKLDASAFFQTERQIGERGLVSATIMSSLCHRAGDVCPMEELMIAHHTDRSFFDSLVGLFHEAMMKEVRACLAAGIRFFMANYYYNSLSSGWSPQIWRDSFAPGLREFAGAVHAAGGLLSIYDDGKMSAILELLADCGVDVLQTLTPPPVGDVSLADAKRRVGHRVCLMGGIDLIYTLLRGTPAMIEGAVRDAIAAAASGGGYILGTSDSIRDGTPVENVRAFCQAARRYGAGAMQHVGKGLL